MNLTFLNPFLLIGLAAGVLPILIHRLTQKKATTRKFSAVRLLLQSQRVTARPQRLKHLLLLALRVLAVMTLVFMIARPVFIREGIAALSQGGAKVVILDNSASMGFREERGERYTLAKKAIKEALKDAGGELAIIPMVSGGGEQRMTTAPHWMKPEEAMADLEATPLSFGRGDSISALSVAFQKLKDLKEPGEILIATDMTRGDWERLDLSKLGVISGSDVTFLRIGGPDQDPNFCIKNVSLIEGEAVIGVPARLEVVVSNFSKTSGTVLVQLYLSGVKVDQKSIEIGAGDDGKGYFELFLDKPGWVDGEVRISEDRLPSDDLFYFPLRVREKVRVLMVDGDPRPSLKASESYYLMNALQPGGSEGSPFTFRVVTEEEMAGMDVRPYNALFLLNASKPQASKLASFLDLGKPVFIFLGDRVILGEYNSLPFFPWRIREPMELGPKPERIGEVDQNHETLRSLSTGGNSLKSASFRRYFKIDGSKQNLLTLGNQDPLFVEASVGKSSLYLFTSTADLDWNDLPLKTAFLPLIQGLLKEAVGLTDHSISAGIRVGESFSEKVRPVQIKGYPQGPGIYRLPLPPDEVRRAVNVPYEESDLRKVTEGELKKKFGEIRVKVVEYQEGNLKGLQPGRREVWPFLLAFLMIVLAVEMILANGVSWFKS
jgi:Aerotolerance regulator N-terminal